MKAKLNLDTAKLKEFAIEHTEKIVFGVFGLTLLYFAYSGFLHETYNKTPPNLDDEIRLARSHIDDSQPPEIASGPSVIKKFESSLKPVELDAYATTELIRPNVRDLGSKRGNPTIFPPADLHVATGHGAVTLAKLKNKRNISPKKRNEKKIIGKQNNDLEKMLERSRQDVARKERSRKKKDRNKKDRDVDQEPINTRGIVWTVITGLVPLDQQENEYFEAFSAAIEKEPSDDEPEYIFQQVQRQEIAFDGSAGPWKDVSTSRTKTLMAQWTGNSRQRDLVSARFIQKEICMKLPPVVGYQFGEEAAHPDLIEETEKETNLNSADDEPENIDTGPEGDEDAPEDDEHFKNKKKVKDKVNIEDEFQKLLFRFFDFTVSPGKTYRYRGRVWVRNPNYKVENRHLAEPSIVNGGKKVETNQTKYLISGWGTASPSITVPFLGRIYAGELIPARGREVGMNTPLEMFDRKTGFEVLDVRELHRGQYANFSDGEPLVVRPSSGNSTAQREKKKPLLTDHFLIDIPSESDSSGNRAVVMGPDLKLRVVHESPELVDRISELEGNVEEGPQRSRNSAATNDPFEDQLEQFEQMRNR